MPRESALLRAQHGELVDWNVSEYLLAGIWDAANGANWQRAHGKEKDRPKPIRRPGDQPGKDGDQKFGSGGRSIADIDAILASVADGGDDVSQSKSVPRTSTSSRQRAASKRTSPKN